MATTPTTLYTSFRDQFNEPTAQFIGAGELRTYLYQALTILDTRFGLSPTYSNEITTVSGTQEYSLLGVGNSEVFYSDNKSVIIEVQYNNVRLKKVNKRQLAGIQGLAYGGTPESGNPVYYYLDNTFVGNDLGCIGLFPIPDAAKKLEVWFEGSSRTLVLTSGYDANTSILKGYTEMNLVSCIDYMLYRAYLKAQDRRADVHIKLWENNLKNAQIQRERYKHADEVTAVMNEEDFLNTDMGAV